jgi:hypothetical protein
VRNLGLYATDSVGDLTYALSVPIKEYLATHSERYATFAEVLGALDALGKEFNRRVVAPYEDRKRGENGDGVFYDE